MKAIDSGALLAQGGAELFNRIEDTLLYDPGFLRLVRVTMRGMEGPDDVIQHIPRVNGAPAHIFDFDIWVQHETLFDLWRFLLITFIHMSGKELADNINSQRTGAGKEIDSMTGVRVLQLLTPTQSKRTRPLTRRRTTQRRASTSSPALTMIPPYSVLFFFRTDYWKLGPPHSRRR